MLDKRFILDNADLVQKNCDVRGVKADVHRYVQLETECRQMQQQIEELSRQANVVSKSIATAKDDAEREQRKEEGRALREQKEKVQVEMDRLAAEAGAIYRSMPNLTHPEAPVGDDPAKFAAARLKSASSASRCSITWPWPSSTTSLILKAGHASPATVFTF
jgi:seryl-tRNA synthetase